MENFKCEICGCITPVEREGAEPNVCASCLPIKEEEDANGNDFS
jgi:ribosome-binding protein aMBF1 (putative translation factor)